MHKLYKLVFVLLITLFAININNNVSSVDPPKEPVFVQIQAGGNSDNIIGKAATQELISIYNNGLTDIDITGWCILNKNDKPIVCFNFQENFKYIIPSHKYFYVASGSFVLQRHLDFPSEQPFVPDYSYTPANSASGDIIASSDDLTFLSNDDIEYDNINWTQGLAKGFLYLRKPSLSISNKYVDSDIVADDFTITSVLAIPPNITGVCPNIEGYQEFVHDGLIVDEYGNCVEPPISACKNIPNMEEVPPGYDLDDEGNCIEHDECSNIDEVQSSIPGGYVRSEGNTCVLNILPIIITELLPNPKDSDDGNEYIEIYNPNESDVDLLYYVFYIGSDEAHFYSFPVGAKIGAKQYLKYTDHDINFTLVNTTSSARLRPIDNSFVDVVPAYNNPADGQAWALIDGIWQWTNRPTPGAANIESLIEIIDDEITEPEGLKPCAANQYRNPLTNRCKLIPEYESQLLPCRDGQYRSEETNRCRNIVSDVADLVPCAEGQERNPATNRCRMIASEVASLVPCAEGQERNPLTNRCRSITSVLGASDLVPCKEGQERNPETNRCRNIVSMPNADYAPEKVSENVNNSSMWLLLAGVGGLAFGYAIWEWRRELVKLAHILKSALHIRK